MQEWFSHNEKLPLSSKYRRRGALFHGNPRNYAGNTLPVVVTSVPSDSVITQNPFHCSVLVLNNSV